MSVVMVVGVGMTVLDVLFEVQVPMLNPLRNIFQQALKQEPNKDEESHLLRRIGIRFRHQVQKQQAHEVGAPKSQHQRQLALESLSGQLKEPPAQPGYCQQQQ